MRRVLALCASLVAAPLAAAEIVALEVTHESGVYTVRAEMLVAAEPVAVQRALLDFPNLGRLSPSIRASSVVGETPDGPLVFTRSKACAGWFCRTVRQTQLVQVAGDTITATALPEQSNVTVGHTVWKLSPEPGPDGIHTRLLWVSVLDPAFFVPPLIGPPLVKRALRLEADLMAQGLERTAQGEPARAAEEREPYRPRGAGPAREDDGG